MGPRERGISVPFRVTIDGEPLHGAGSDVDRTGSGILSQQRMHQLVRQGPIVDRWFEFEFLEPGAEAFAFTFG
jgi:hypothetical protein